MSIGKRIVRLVKADIHGILDCLEDPLSVLQQAIRDMEEEIAKSERELAQSREEAGRFEQLRSRSESAQTEASRQLDICFDTGNELLAKTFMRKRLETERRLKAIAQHISENSRTQSALESRMKEQHEKLASIREKTELFLQQEPTTAANEDCASGVTEEQVELAMLEEKQKRQSSRAA